MIRRSYLDLYRNARGLDASAELGPEDVWRPPTDETAAQVKRLPDLIGSLPLSLRAWWEVVGSISLQGAFPSEDGRTVLPFSDPLVVFPLRDVLAEAESALDEERMCLPIAPDIFHKSDVCGAEAYEIQVSDRRADAPLRNVRIALPSAPGTRSLYRMVEVDETFVEYLRRSFEWAGFPGYAFAHAFATTPSLETDESILSPARDVACLAPLFPRMLPL